MCRDTLQLLYFSSKTISSDKIILEKPKLSKSLDNVQAKLAYPPNKKGNLEKVGEKLFHKIRDNLSNEDLVKTSDINFFDTISNIRKVDISDKKLSNYKRFNLTKRLDFFKVRSLSKSSKFTEKIENNIKSIDHSLINKENSLNFSDREKRIFKSLILNDHREYTGRLKENIKPEQLNISLIDRNNRESSVAYKNVLSNNSSGINKKRVVPKKDFNSRGIIDSGLFFKDSSREEKVTPINFNQKSIGEKNLKNISRSNSKIKIADPGVLIEKKISVPNSKANKFTLSSIGIKNITLRNSIESLGTLKNEKRSDNTISLKSNSNTTSSVPKVINLEENSIIENSYNFSDEKLKNSNYYEFGKHKEIITNFSEHNETTYKNSLKNSIKPFNDKTNIEYRKSSFDSPKSLEIYFEDSLNHNNINSKSNDTGEISSKGLEVKKDIHNGVEKLKVKFINNETVASSTNLNLDTQSMESFSVDVENGVDIVDRIKFIEDLSKVVMRSVKDEPINKFSIQIDPEKLGKVKVELEKVESGYNLKLIFSQNESKESAEKSKEILHREFQKNGFVLNRVEILESNDFQYQHQGNENQENSNNRENNREDNPKRDKEKDSSSNEKPIHNFIDILGEKFNI
ncbi:MAG: hypothetical protein CR982_09945 [Candidatus Cloacimonadota bacterium]|nr:MAG: hypothetical protein CR982_09945 [Candidatus Cloacimonadota bacterium]PIE78424.1 MAG: hypothetical protein CSA15_07890 [Candidatus Delongbacteria bacterium]